MSRNVFHQYEQQENRLTHALACALESDPRAKSSFVREFLGLRGLKHAQALLVESQVPERGDGRTRGSTPDLVLRTSDETFALAIESKVLDSPKANQLQRHEAGLRRRGFLRQAVALISVEPAASIPKGFIQRQWRQVYAWARDQRGGPKSLVPALAEFLEIIEEETVNRGRGWIMTEFKGILFDKKRPYEYPAAKAELKRLMSALWARKDYLRKLGVPVVGQGRGSITENTGAVWDMIPFERSAGKSAPHYTIAITPEYLQCQISLPNGLSGSRRKAIKQMGEEAFSQELHGITRAMCKALKPYAKAFPMMEMLQRRYKTQKSEPYLNARLDFDLRTAFPREQRTAKKGEPSPDFQPEWFGAAYRAFHDKHSNLQMAIGARIPYQKATDRKELVEDIFRVWLTLDPIASKLR